MTPQTHAVVWLGLEADITHRSKWRPAGGFAALCTENGLKDGCLCSVLLARSRDGLRRIQQIVSDLRHFARLDDTDLHEADLNAGIESTINIVQGKAKNRRIGIVQDHGGSIDVESTPGKGATFVVVLPLRARKE